MLLELGTDCAAQGWGKRVYWYRQDKPEEEQIETRKGQCDVSEREGKKQKVSLYLKYVLCHATRLLLMQS